MKGHPVTTNNIMETKKYLTREELEAIGFEFVEFKPEFARATTNDDGNIIIGMGDNNGVFFNTALSYILRVSTNTLINCIGATYYASNISPLERAKILAEVIRTLKEDGCTVAVQHLKEGSLIYNFYGDVEASSTKEWNRYTFWH